MARAYERERWLEDAANAPPYVVSLETAQLCNRHSVSVEGEASLSKGWTRNAVSVSVAPRLCGKERVDFIMRQWHALSFEQNLDPKYSISVPYWHAVVDVEYEGHCAGNFLPTGMREPTPELCIRRQRRSRG